MPQVPNCMEDHSGWEGVKVPDGPQVEGLCPPAFEYPAPEAREHFDPDTDVAVIRGDLTGEVRGALIPVVRRDFDETPAGC